MLADRIAAASLERLREIELTTTMGAVEVAPLAVDVARASVTGVPSVELQAAIEQIAAADAVIAAAPVYKAGISGLFKSFVDVLDDDLLMQFQADVLGSPVAAPAVTEITATGAAYAAGLATGFWSGLDELRANYTTTRRWQPQMNSDERADGVAAWRRAVDRTLGLVDTERDTVGTLSGAKTFARSAPG